jgi:hypothetical protein
MHDFDAAVAGTCPRYRQEEALRVLRAGRTSTATAPATSTLPARRLTVLAIAALAIAALSAVVAGCANPALSERPFSVERSGEQIYPANYRAELLVYLRNYLNDPTQVREAMIAEPATRMFGGRQRYIVCLRYNARTLSGTYSGVSDRMATYLDGRFDRLIEDARDYCAGAAYVPFPELEKLKR